MCNLDCVVRYHGRERQTDGLGQNAIESRRRTYFIDTRVKVRHELKMTGIRRETQWYKQTAYDLMEGVWSGHGFETAAIHPIAIVQDSV